MQQLFEFRYVLIERTDFDGALTMIHNFSVCRQSASPMRLALSLRDWPHPRNPWTFRCRSQQLFELLIRCWLLWIRQSSIPVSFLIDHYEGDNVVKQIMQSDCIGGAARCSKILNEHQFVYIRENNGPYRRITYTKPGYKQISSKYFFCMS